MICPVINLSK